MLTNQDIAKLAAIFATKEDLTAMGNSLESRLEERLEKHLEKRLGELGQRLGERLEKHLEKKFVTKAEFFEQMTFIAQEFEKLHARMERMEERMSKSEKFIEACTMKLLNHEGRLVTLESKNLLN